MSMTVSTGDDADELDDDLDEDRDDDDLDDDEDERPRSKGKQKPEPDDEDDDDEDKSPEDLKAEIKRLRSSLSKANSSGNRRRQQLKEMRAAQKALEDKDDDLDEDDDDDESPKAKQKAQVGLDAKAAQRLITKAVSRRERELQEEHTRDLIDTRFESALIKAGVAEKNIRLLMREVDHDELELDPKTKRVDGIDEETDRLKSEFPDLFKAPKSARRRINGGDDRDTTSKRKTLSATEKQVLALTGRPR